MWVLLVASFQPRGVSGTLSPSILCLGYTPQPEIPIHWWTLVTRPHLDARGTGNHSPWLGCPFPVTVVLSERENASISGPLFFSITQAQKCCKVTQLLSGRKGDLKPSLSKSTICPLNYHAFFWWENYVLKKRTQLIYLMTSNHTLQGRSTQEFWNDDNDVHSLLLHFWFTSSPSSWSFPGISMLESTTLNPLICPT